MMSGHQDGMNGHTHTVLLSIRGAANFAPPPPHGTLRSEVFRNCARTVPTWYHFGTDLFPLRFGPLRAHFGTLRAIPSFRGGVAAPWNSRVKSGVKSFGDPLSLAAPSFIHSVVGRRQVGSSTRDQLNSLSCMTGAFYTQLQRTQCT